MKKSPTDFAHVFKNHDPLRIFEILIQSLNELNQKRQLRLKWTKPDRKALTVSFQTKLGIKSTSWAGSQGEARCVASPPNGTELQLVLVPAGGTRTSNGLRQFCLYESAATSLLHTGFFDQ